jgi:hypothetical protein
LMGFGYVAFSWVCFFSFLFFIPMPDCTNVPYHRIILMYHACVSLLWSNDRDVPLMLEGTHVLEPTAVAKIRYTWKLVRGNWSMIADGRRTPDAVNAAPKAVPDIAVGMNDLRRHDSCSTFSGCHGST